MTFGESERDVHDNVEKSRAGVNMSFSIVLLLQ